MQSRINSPAAKFEYPKKKNLKKEYRQPVLKSMYSKGSWSLGKRIRSQKGELNSLLSDSAVKTDATCELLNCAGQ